MLGTNRLTLWSSDAVSTFGKPATEQLTSAVLTYGSLAPAGIAAVYRSIVARRGDAHAAEHDMIECLAEALWEAQRQNRPPDEAAYLERLRKL